jgi:hypothetical protein
MHVDIFWNIEPCSPYVSRRFGGMYHLYLQGRKSDEYEVTVLAGVLGPSCAASFDGRCSYADRLTDLLLKRNRPHSPGSGQYKHLIKPRLLSPRVEAG